MGANDGRINQQVFHIGVTGKGLVQMLEDALRAPPRKSAIDGVPVAVFFWQQSPLCATARNPQNGREKAAAFMLLSDIKVWMRQ